MFDVGCSFYRDGRPGPSRPGNPQIRVIFGEVPAGGAGRSSGRLQVEAQVSSVQGYDEPVKDVSPDQHVTSVCGNASHRRQFVALKTEPDVIHWTLGD